MGLLGFEFVVRCSFCRAEERYKSQKEEIRMLRGFFPSSDHREFGYLNGVTFCSVFRLTHRQPTLMAEIREMERNLARITISLGFLFLRALLCFARSACRMASWFRDSGKGSNSVSYHRAATQFLRNEFLNQNRSPDQRFLQLKIAVYRFRSSSSWLTEHSRYAIGTSGGISSAIIGIAVVSSSCRVTHAPPAHVALMGCRNRCSRSGCGGNSNDE